MQSFAVEHIIPLQAGGKNVLENLALACEGCNSHKHTKIQAIDPISGKFTSLFHPRQHRWLEHFRWSDDSTKIFGLTPTGRATIEALQMNRKGLVNLRRVLYAMGEHPPEEPLEPA